jgi:hypothetical protein
VSSVRTPGDCSRAQLAQRSPEKRPGAATKADSARPVPPRTEKPYEKSSVHCKLLFTASARLRPLVFSGSRIPLLPARFAILVGRGSLATSAPAIAHVAQLITTLLRKLGAVGKFVDDFIHFALGYWVVSVERNLLFQNDVDLMADVRFT